MQILCYWIAFVFGKGIFKMKKCNLCKKVKPISTFHKNKNRIQSNCRECQNFMSKEYRKNNEKKYYETYKNTRLKREYGISLIQYNEILKNQNNSCAICESTDTGRKDSKSFAVDHCHKTGKIRGLLCMRCNTDIGKFRDDVNLLQKAIDYLNVRKF